MQALSLLILLPTVATAAPSPGIPDGWSDGFIYANGARLQYYHAVQNFTMPVIRSDLRPSQVLLAIGTVSASVGQTESSDSCGFATVTKRIGEVRALAPDRLSCASR